MARSRAAGIPTRLLYGSFLKQELDGQDVDQSYHCWVEFYAPEIGWVPLDVAVADIFVGDFNVTPQNDELVRRTTALPGYIALLLGRHRRKPTAFLANPFHGTPPRRHLFMGVRRADQLQGM